MIFGQLNKDICENYSDPLQLTGGGRNEVLDCLKCYLIFLVIFGHVLYLTDPVFDDRFIKTFISWIWFFHMPAFTLASGYFYKKNQGLKKILYSSAKLLLTYAIMQIIISAIYGPFDCYSLLLIPQYAMWYLPALVFWRLFAYVCLKQTDNLFLILIISVIISLGTGFVQFNYLGFQRACSFLPFFFMGMILNQYNLIPIIRRYRIYGAGILLLLLLAFYLPNRAICSGMCNVPYKDLYHLLSRCSVLFLGAVMSLAFISSIPITKIASKVGKHTLFIYCYHVFFVFHVVPNIWNQLGIIPCFIIVLIYSLFVFVVLALLSNIKVLNYIINPLR